MGTEAAAQQSGRELSAARAELEELHSRLQRLEAAPQAAQSELVSVDSNGAADAAQEVEAEVEVAVGLSSSEDDELQQRLSAADAAAAAALADAAAAQQRVFQIRAEAAMLVETVEDRAQEVRQGGGRARVGRGGVGLMVGCRVNSEETV